MKKQLTFLLALASLNLAKAQTLTVDLAKNLNKTFSQTIEPKKVNEIVLLNRVLTGNYDLVVKKERQPIPPLDISGLSGGRGGACANLGAATSNLLNQAEEAKIPDAIIALQKEIDLAKKAGGCEDDVIKGERTIAKATGHFILAEPLEIRSGDKVTITITKDEKTKWTYIFETEQISHSKIFYGFSYMFANALTHFPNYYSQASGDTYLITQMHNDTKNVFQNISPTIMYSFVFFRDPDAKFKFGLTGGVIADLSKPAVTLSPSLIIGDIFAINAGLAMAQKDQLKGQYMPGMTIKDNLDFDQLHNKVWTYDIFLSLSFHFTTNPFKKKSESAGDK